MFGGAAHVLLQKQLSTIEIYNDINNDLVNLFCIARDKPEELIRRLETLLYSRTLYKRWLKDWEQGNKGKSDIERAVRYFYLQNLCFSGWFGSTFSTSKEQNSAKTFHTKVNKLNAFSERFKTVVIENLDYKEIINKYDSPDTLFYCDPPYIDVSDYYSTEWTFNDHKELADCLNLVHGKVILSYYNLAILEKLYPDWFYDKIDVAMHSERSDKKQIKTEVLICNFDFKKEATFIDKAQTTLFDDLKLSTELSFNKTLSIDERISKLRSQNKSWRQISLELGVSHEKCRQIYKTQKNEGVETCIKNS